MNCRHCRQKLDHTFLDLGFAPPSNAYLSRNQLNSPERYYPLRIKVCNNCWLVQTEDYTDSGELFDKNYAYFSSISKGWLKHAEKYTQSITERLSLDENSFVVEIASNDGYLLRNFVALKIPCLGIEPTASTASKSLELNIPTLQEFFGNSLAKRLVAEGKQADLITGNNVYAHVPDINDFTKGLASLLKPTGTITLEFPHLLNLIEFGQFDTIYHEHFSYLSLTVVISIFEQAGLSVVDVEELETHGGSLRVYGKHTTTQDKRSGNVERILENERLKGLASLPIYRSFQERTDHTKNELLKFLINAYEKNQTVSAYGAAAKGNTLLNYAGIKPGLIDVVYDAAPSKQGMYLPGSHVPILNPKQIRENKPDWLLILPWNLAKEVSEEHHYIEEWGGRFLVAIPQLEILC